MTAPASTRVGYVGYVGQWSLLTDPGLQYFVFSPVTGPSLAFKRWWSLSFLILIYICFLFDSSVFLNLFQIFSCHKMEMWVTSLKDMLSFLLHSFVLLSLISFFLCLVYWLWGLLSLKVGGKDYLANINTAVPNKRIGKRQIICPFVYSSTNLPTLSTGVSSTGNSRRGSHAAVPPAKLIHPGCYPHLLVLIPPCRGYNHMFTSLGWPGSYLMVHSFLSFFCSFLFVFVYLCSSSICVGFFFFRSLPFFCLLNFFAWVCV